MRSLLPVKSLLCCRQKEGWDRLDYFRYHLANVIQASIYVIMRTWPGAFDSGHLSVKITLDISHVTVSFSVYQSSQRSFFIQCDVRAKGSNVAGKCCEDLLENCRSFLFR